MADEMKLLILGTGGVGKSSIVLRLVSNKFQDTYDPTIEDSYRKEVEVDGEHTMLNILDTSGQDDYATMRGTYVRNAEGFLLVYSLTSSASMDDLGDFYKEIARNFPKGAPVVVCANKADLAAKNRQVETSKGEELAKSYNNAKYFETSAKDGTNVTDAFSQLVRQVREARKAKTAKRRPGGGKDKSCNIL